VLGEADASIELHASVVERLGNHTVAYATMSGKEEIFCTVQEGTAPIKANTSFSVGINASDCHLFDENGKAFERDIDLSNLGLPEVA
jgi:multiple sugar transport system ATP-binding protein